MENTLDSCLHLVLKKFNRGEPENWEPRIFNKLSSTVKESSNISISPHTLKRLYGKVKTAEDYDPQHATKEALAKYIGYNSWDDFVSAKDKKIINNDVSKKNRKLSLKLNPIVLGVSLLVIVLVTFFVFFYSKTERFEFTGDKLVGSFPHTATFTYDISKVKTDDVYLDFGDYQKVKLDKSKNLITHSYLFPENFEAKLIIKGTIAKTVFVNVTSNGWFADIIYKPTTQDDRVIFQMKNFMDTAGHLYLNPAAIYALGLPKKQGYWTEFRNIQDIEGDGDNFTIDSKVINNAEMGGISCYDYIMKVLCENGMFEIRFEDKGCIGFIEMRIAEIKIFGKDQYLDYFGKDLSHWSNVSMKVQNKNVSILFNKKEVFSTAYKTTLGKIKGVILVFRGSGACDYVQIKNQNGEIVFKDEFNFIQ